MLTTVTVGIPAHNEELNIGKLLKSILCQKQKGFRLERVLVVLDGCTDNTEKIVRDLACKNPIIRLIADGKRMGKALRLNMIYEENKSDVLITLDADILPENNFIFRELLRPLSDSLVYVVAGNIRPIEGRNFLERAVVAKNNAWHEACKMFLESDNIYNSAGACFALRKEFTQKLIFLEGTINDQKIIYLKTHQIGKRFRLAQKAIFLYREASTWKDLISRARRSQHRENLKFYGLDSILKELQPLPLRNKIKGMYRVFINHPLDGAGAIALMFLLKLILLKRSNSFLVSSGIWEIVESTKKMC